MKQCKRFLGLFLAVLLLASTITAMGAEPIRVVLYGEEIVFDVPPQIINSRTMVPLRAIFEALGASVDWNGDTRTVTSVKDDVTVQLTIDDTTMYVNGTAVTLDTPACIVESRTLVPVRAVSEAFGILVEWYGDKQTVALGSDDGVYEDPLFHNGLVVFCQEEAYTYNQKYGYLNKNGEVAIAPRFDGATQFVNGNALVLIDDVWYSIDTNGTIVAQLPYDVCTLNGGYALVTHKENNGAEIKYGFVNTKGELILPIEYDNLYPFREGLAAACYNDKWGYLNKAGEWAIAPQFDYLEYFSDGIAAVRNGEKYGYINKAGEWVIAPQFDYANDFFEGLAAVEVNEKTGFINKAGEWVIPPKFDYATYFSDGFAEAAVANQYDELDWGYINTAGEWCIAPTLDYSLPFSEGLVALESNGKWGYMNTVGEWVIPPQFDYAGSFHNGYALVEVDRKFGYISKSGYYSIEPQYQDVRSDFSEDGYAVVVDEDYRSFIIDTNGNAVSGAYDYILYY